MIKSPFLLNVRAKDSKRSSTLYPFSIPFIRSGNFNLEIKKPILIISGDNGVGKSTLLEIIASSCGFNISGGSKSHLYNGQKNDVKAILKNINFSWKIKVNNGFFMRADSFNQFAIYLDELAKFDRRSYKPYGGKSLNEQSHGESFLSLFENRFGTRGIYILDEPEAALSPQKILSFMVMINELSKTGDAQFIISTHSPMLMAMPDAQFIYIKDSELIEMDYKETEHFQITKSFLNNPERMLKYLLKDEN